ncbi:MAG TPA: MmgE/PrpD family protein [Solirubrobacteraceae bacterium]
MTPVAASLAAWAAGLEPSDDDLALARRSLVDTVAVAIAARGHPIGDLLGELSEAETWAVRAHVLDFDDLHMGSTAHVSAVCVPAVLATGGDARGYLAAAGVMARLGTALGWAHYAAGWHATCTAGAPAAAVGAAVALGLGAEEVATAMALAVPAAGGVQRAFGTSGKALQVGAVAQAGVRAARLAAAGASADPRTVDQWLALVGGEADRLALDGPAIPGGLAVKLFPCCYALQRPIAALRAIDAEPGQVARVVVRTPQSALAPLIHAAPTTGLEGKFSLQYAVAATLLDGRPGIESFTDAAVARPAAQALLARVEVDAAPGGDWLLAGDVAIELTLADGATLHAQLDLPPGAPDRPPSSAELAEKVADCTGDLADEVLAVDWADAGALLRQRLPGPRTSNVGPTPS